LNFYTRCGIQLPLFREEEEREKNCVKITPSLRLSPHSSLAGRE
jgi:hypothetical protein